MKTETGRIIEPRARLDIRSDIDGVLIHAWNPNDPEDQKHFWVFHLGVFDSWAEVDRLARIGAGNYQMELATI